MARIEEYKGTQRIYGKWNRSEATHGGDKKGGRGIYLSGRMIKKDEE